MKRGAGLVEIMVVIVIIAILAAVLLPNYLGKGEGRGSERRRAPREAAQGVQCSSNLQQIRSALQMASMDETARPQTLAGLRSYGVTESISVCPVSRQPYRLNAATQQVGCTDPAHASF